MNNIPGFKCLDISNVFLLSLLCLQEVWGRGLPSDRSWLGRLCRLNGSQWESEVFLAGCEGVVLPPWSTPGSHGRSESVRVQARRRGSHSLRGVSNITHIAAHAAIIWFKMDGAGEKKKNYIWDWRDFPLITDISFCLIMIVVDFVINYLAVINANNLMMRQIKLNIFRYFSWGFVFCYLRFSRFKTR